MSDERRMERERERERERESACAISSGALCVSDHLGGQAMRTSFMNEGIGRYCNLRIGELDSLSCQARYRLILPAVYRVF